MDKIFSELETDTEFLNNEEAVESFIEKLNTFSGKTIDQFIDEELNQQINLMKQLLERHKQISDFLEAIETTESDVVVDTYI